MRSAGSAASWVVIVALLGCSSGGSGGPNPPPPPPPPPNPVPTNMVEVRDPGSYSPTTASISAGATVTWTWVGSTTHSVTFQDGQGSHAGQVSGMHQRTFATAGTYRYRCTFHSTNFDSGMIGSIVVQ